MRHKRHGLDPWVEKIPLEEGMATHSSIFAWRIPWTEKPGGLQSVGSKIIKHNWSDLACTQGKSQRLTCSVIHVHSYIISQSSKTLGRDSCLPSGISEDRNINGVTQKIPVEKPLVWWSKSLRHTWETHKVLGNFCPSTDHTQRPTPDLDDWNNETWDF